MLLLVEEAYRSADAALLSGLLRVRDPKILDAEFFKAHPEFNGEVDATVIADGQVLLSAKSAKRRATEDEDADPVMLGFLSFLQKQMVEHPDLIELADRAQLARIRKLVKGVDVE